MKRKSTLTEMEKICYYPKRRQTFIELDLINIPNNYIDIGKRQNIKIKREIILIKDIDDDLSKKINEISDVMKSLGIIKPLSQHEEQIRIMEEERVNLINENNALNIAVNNSIHRIIPKRNAITLSENYLEKHKEIINTKKEKIIELLKYKEELEQQLTEALEEEKKFQEEDKLIELAIHQMKGRLYSLMITDKDQRTHYRKYGNLFETVIPQKTDSWIRMKFDQAICADKEYLHECLFEYTKGVLEKVIYDLLNNTEDKKLPREITYFILSLHNRMEFIQSYIKEILENIKKTFEIRIMASVYSLSENKDTLPLILGEISQPENQISEYIKIIAENQKIYKRGNNYALELVMKEIGASLRFVFINTEDENNLEEIQRRARDIYQTKLNDRKYSVRGYDTLKIGRAHV